MFFPNHLRFGALNNVPAMPDFSFRNANFSLALLHSPQRTARWSYYCAEPMAEFKARGNSVQIDGVQKTNVQPLEELKAAFQRHACVHSPLRDPNGPPFQGGAVGYLSYEALHYLEDVSLPKQDDVQAPWMDFLFFDAGVAFDHQEKEFRSFGPKQKTTALEARFAAALDDLRNDASVSTGRTGPITSNFSKAAYVAAVKEIQSCIAAGETFQANVSQRFQVETTKTPWDVFCKLNQINPSPYSAFFQTDDLSIASASPELLFSIEGDRIVTRPIAGTRPRGKTVVQDQELEAELKANAKENAEHAMLVDLERNDVGRICRAGSVRVQEGFVVEKYSHVQHLVSQVEGRLLQGKTAFDALRALFPGGTITGCPKVRTMEILRHVEPVARGPYTGSLGWIGWNGDAAFNILIRTIYFKHEKKTAAGLRKKKKTNSTSLAASAPLNPAGSWRAYFHAGGGIVYDSVPEREYEESLQKAEAMKLALK